MIGGNTAVTIQIKNNSQKNEIGERVPAWESVQSIEGWLDLSSGDSSYTTYNTKIPESTHVFIADYEELDKRIKAENSRLVDEDGLVYDIVLIDDPMKMHRQLEFYLKFTGAQ